MRSQMGGSAFCTLSPNQLNFPLGGFAYDTIHASGHTDDHVKTMQCLDNIGETKKRFGVPLLVGNLENLIVEVNEDTNHVTVRNSITGFRNGHNISSLSQLEYHETVEEISQLLSLEFSQFRVSKLATNITIPLDCYPVEILRMMGNFHTQKGRIIEPNKHSSTRTYKLSSYQELQYYDKSSEANLRDISLLRGEYTMKNHIGRILGGVTISDILTPRFFRSQISTLCDMTNQVGIYEDDSIYTNKEFRRLIQDSKKNAFSELRL